jgi:hypothetical protein
MMLTMVKNELSGEGKIISYHPSGEGKIISYHPHYPKELRRSFMPTA